MSQHHPKKIAIMGSGAIGTELLSILQSQYPNDHFVVWNRESDNGTGTAIRTDQQVSIASKFRRSPQRNKRFEFVTSLDAAMENADIVILAGGVPRKNPQQTRIDLAQDNVPFIDMIAKRAGELERAHPEKKTNYIIGTNPIGLTDARFQEVSKIPHNQIIGLSGELDVERLRQSIRLHLRVGNDDIRGARVIGDHGPNMVPVLSQIEIHRNGQWQKLLDLPEVKANDGALLKEFKTATAKGGTKLVAWNGRSDFLAPAAALAYIVEQIYDARWGEKDKSLPVTTSSFDPESGIYSGQTVKFSEDGTYTLAQTPALDASEQSALTISKEAAKADWQKFQASTRHIAPSTPPGVAACIG